MMAHEGAILATRGMHPKERDQDYNSVYFGGLLKTTTSHFTSKQSSNAFHLKYLFDRMKHPSLWNSAMFSQATKSMRQPMLFAT